MRFCCYTSHTQWLSSVTVNRNWRTIEDDNPLVRVSPRSRVLRSSLWDLNFPRLWLETATLCSSVHMYLSAKRGGVTSQKKAIFKTCPAFYGTQRSTAMFTEACQLIRQTPSQLIFKFHLNIILPSLPEPLRWYLPSSWTKILHVSQLFHACWLSR